MKLKVTRTDGTVIEAEGELSELVALNLIPPYFTITSPPIVPTYPDRWPYGGISYGDGIIGIGGTCGYITNAEKSDQEKSGIEKAQELVEAYKKHGG